MGKYNWYRFLASLRSFLSINFFIGKRVVWFSCEKNFGDLINRDLIKAIGKNRISQVYSTEFIRFSHFLVIGSVLQISNNKSIVWGSGFHFATSKFFYEPPQKVLSVRGALTRDKLLQLNISCPEVYGDPALMTPGIFIPQVQKKYKLGIIPHYINLNDKWLSVLKNRNDFLIINVKEAPFDVISKILQCENIISSSLHGLIISDAYNIPNLWIEFSQKIGADRFKFYDYFSGVGRSHQNVLEIDNQLPEEIIDLIPSVKINYNPIPLLDSCPFNVSYMVYTSIIEWYKKHKGNAANF